MTIERIHPAGTPDPVVPLSQGIRAGDFLYVSGQVATDAQGNVVGGDFDAEVHLTLDNVEAILRAGGADFSKVVKVNAWLSTGMLFARFNEIYAQRMGGARPARTTVCVDFGHPDVRVEVDAIAYLG